MDMLGSSHSHGIKFLANLIILVTKGLEVVIGMDWMSQHQ
jgi:hypothetical protein